MGALAHLTPAGPSTRSVSELRERQRTQIVDGVVSIGVARTAAIVIDGLCYVVVARYLGPGEYGQYLAVMAYLTLIELTDDMTLVDITVREISNDRDNTGMWVSAATLLRMGMSAAGFLAYAAYVSFGPGRRTPSLLPAAWIAALMLPAGALRMPIAAFRAHLKMHYELVIIVVTRLANLLLFLLCINSRAGLPQLFLATVVSRLLLALLAWTTLVRLMSTKLRFEMTPLKRLARESV